MSEINSTKIHSLIEDISINYDNYDIRSGEYVYISAGDGLDIDPHFDPDFDPDFEPDLDAQILVENENMSCPNPSLHDDFPHLVIDDVPTVRNTVYNEYTPINLIKFDLISKYISK